MPGRPLTILQLTHQGGPAGSTQSIFNLSEHLARRGHRVLVGCRDDVLLARLARAARLDVVPFDFTRLGSLARVLQGVSPQQGGAGVNAHAARDCRAPPGLRRPGRDAFVGVERDGGLRALDVAVLTRQRVAFVPLSEWPALPFCRLATAAALPSRIAAPSQPLLTAMALGLPVVASDAGGNPHL